MRAILILLNFIGDSSKHHRGKEIKTNRTYEYDENWELTRCMEKVEGGKITIYNYNYDKVGNRTRCPDGSDV